MVSSFGTVKTVVRAPGLPEGRGYGAGRQGQDSAMGWQRSLCIGVCLVGFAAVVQAEEAATTARPPPARSRQEHEAIPATRRPVRSVTLRGMAASATGSGWRVGGRSGRVKPPAGHAL